MLRLSGAGTPGGIRVEANGMWDDLALAAADLHTVRGQHRLHVPHVLGFARSSKPLGPRAGPENWGAGLDVGGYRRTGLGRGSL